MAPSSLPKIHYGSKGQAECGVEGRSIQLTEVPAKVTCPTCRGWLPLVAPELQLRSSPSSPARAHALIGMACEDAERRAFEKVHLRTSDVRALLSAYETEIEALKQWRQWAQFVYLGGGPVVLDDDALRRCMNKKHDSETDALKAEQFTDDGQWICETCGFRLTRAILRAFDGAVGMDRKEVEDICPNDGTSLRRLTWREDAENANRVGLEMFKRNSELEAQLAALTASKEPQKVNP